MQISTIEKLVDIKELSNQLGGVSRSTIYRHIKNLPDFPQPLKVGAATRFRLGDVQLFIDNVGRDVEVGKQ